MADFGGYYQWLSTLQPQPAFINNYWSAMLAFDMEESNPSDGLKIPYSDVVDELFKEDKNVNLPDTEAYISPVLRHWLVHLLKAYDGNVNILTVEDVLRSFLHNNRSTGIAFPPFPLSRSTLFHSMPSECKLWLFYTLRTYKKPSRSLPTVKKDALGNGYHIISDCRLYVSLERSENATLPINEERLKNQPWGPLYRFVHSQFCILLCENRGGWDVVWEVFQHFNLTDLSNSIRQEMNVRLTKNHLQTMIRDKNRREFQEFSSKLAPIPKAEILESLSKNAKKKQKKTSIDTHASNTALNNLEAEVKAMNINNPNPNPTSNYAQGPQKKTSDEIMGKCWNFPQCPLKGKCKYDHPKIPCTKFPNCPHGWKCLFLHTPCPNDAQCNDIYCAYEHYKSMPTYYRKPREAETAKKPIASVAPVMREEPKKNSNRTTEVPQRRPTTPSIHDGKKRCQFFPKMCTKFHTDLFFHPTEKCKSLASTGKCSEGRRCFFLHGICPDDGSCEGFTCIFEHSKSLPVVQRILEARKGPNQGSLSRATSMTNLSTCTGYSRGRRKSVTFDFDSDEEEKILKKDSTNTKPTGILRNTVKNTTEICPFGSRCTNQNCEKSHPTKQCNAFPKCPNGGICMFLHEKCKNDGVCRRENCDSVHELPHHIENSWCKNGSRCRRADCKFLHPEECIGRCPTPGECWKYHRPSKTMAAGRPVQQPNSPAQPAPQAHAPPVPPRRTTSQHPASNTGPRNNSGPVHGPGVGLHGAPLFAPPPGAPFGYGMPGNGSNMGYVPYPPFGAPGMVPHGYGPYPVYGPGGPNGPYPAPNYPGPNFPPQTYPGLNPTPRVATTREEPPPPYLNGNVTREEREFLERKRDGSTRF